MKGSLKKGQHMICIRRRAWKNQYLYQQSGNMLPCYMQHLSIRTIYIDLDGIYLRFNELLNPQTETGEIQFKLEGNFKPATKNINRELIESIIKRDKRVKEVMDKLE